MLKKIKYFFTISIPSPNYFSTLNLKLVLKKNSLTILSSTDTQLSLAQRQSGKKNSKSNKIAKVPASTTSGSMKKKD